MPYARKGTYGKSRKMRRKKRRAVPWYNRKYSVGDMAYGAYKGVQYLKTMINSEVYKNDVTQTDNPGSSGVITHLTGIAQGDGDGQRTGLSILCKGISFRYVGTIGASATDSFVRILIIRDLQQAADTVPTISNVLESVTVIGHLNSESVGRYQILYDRVHQLQSVNVKTYYGKVYLRVNKHLRYNGSLGSDIQKDGMFVITLSNEATNVPSCSWTSRLYYYDN